MANSKQNTFDNVYENHTWLGRSRSGPGSDAERTNEFRTLLEEFLRNHKIRSVVDLGCGDWSYSRLVDWGDAQYTGIDVVESVIESNRRNYEKPGIAFKYIDSVDQDVPRGDLLIVKEVLQHLPTHDVLLILAKAQSFKYAIFVNDISHQIRADWKRLWRWESPCSTNNDIERGGYRLLSLREPPFSLQATHLLTYRNHYKNRRWEKEVLLWTAAKPV